jgi:hypothetical protein
MFGGGAAAGRQNIATAAQTKAPRVSGKRIDLTRISSNQTAKNQHYS